jgi:hypothetical protein
MLLAGRRMTAADKVVTITIAEHVTDDGTLCTSQPEIREWVGASQDPRVGAAAV